MERVPISEKPYMRDPKMAFRCGEKQIKLKRESGGRIKFELAGFPEYEFRYLKFAFIHTSKQFEALWEFLGGDKELPKKGERKFPPVERPTDISGFSI